jgi:Tfp pilus assembly protein PilO
MRKGLHIQVKPSEWLILAASLLLCGAIYALLIQPSLDLIGEGANARRQKRTAERQLASTTEAYENLQKRLKSEQEQLTELGGAPPSARENDRQVARLTSLAQQLLITIDRYQPISTVDQSDHRAFIVEFVGRGSFSALQQYFREIERNVDFVDVTNFSLANIEGHEPPICLATWSCRMNGTHIGAASDLTAHQRESGPQLREVVRNEP